MCKNNKKRKFYPFSRFKKDSKTDNGRSLHYKDKEDVWEIKREYWTGKEKTPTKLPADLIKKILLYSSRKNDLVFDPFLGSGQVAVVSKMLGRKYYGFEIVKEYYNFAKKRIKKSFIAVILISSVKALYPPKFRHYVDTKGMKSSPFYGSMKAASLMLIKHFASEYRDLNITFNAIAPGGIEGENHSNEFKKR